MTKSVKQRHECSEGDWKAKTLREPNFGVAYGAKRVCRVCGRVQFADFTAGWSGGPWMDVPVKRRNHEDHAGCFRICDDVYGRVRAAFNTGVLFHIAVGGAVVSTGVLGTSRMSKIVKQTVQDADWIGKIERRFNWWRFRFGWGRWHYKTNCCGEVARKWWVWEPKDDGPAWVRVGDYEVRTFVDAAHRQRCAEMQFRGWERLGRPKCESVRPVSGIDVSERKTDDNG
jgi:hypothetical protein